MAPADANAATATPTTRHHGHAPNQLARGDPQPVGRIIKTPAGTYRANWRDPAGKQKAKTFRTRKRSGSAPCCH